MLKFFGVLVFILLPLFLLTLAVGRRLEKSEERVEHDRAIREGINALKRRVLTLERLREARRERS